MYWTLSKSCGQEDEDVREVIDEEDWENFVASIEELLEDLEE